MNWYKESYRKLFFDFHTHSSAVEVAREFNAEKWAEELETTGAQAVSAFAKCGYGWRYYLDGKVGWLHPKLPSNLDMLGETIEACHKRGIKVIAYYHTFNSEPIAERFPEWIEKDSEGKARGISICMISPLLEEHMLPQVEEIARNYEIDGLFFDGTYAHSPCYCRYCREKFKKATGLEIPIDFNDPNWKIYIDWKLETFREIRKKVIEAVHRGRKDVLVAFNWAYTLRQPEIPPEDIGFLTLDIFPDNQAFNASYQTKYWTTLNKPFDIMNSAFLQWWGDWGMKPSVTLKQECATIIANGGKTFIGYQMYPQFKVEEAVMRELKDTLEFVKEREEVCKDSVVIPYIAVLHSTSSHFTRKPNFFVDETSLRGLHKILLESGIHYNIVNEKTLLESIDNYKLIILPDQRYIEAELLNALKKFVENGGSLIATYLTATENRDFEFTGSFLLEDIFGVKFEGFYPYSHGYIELRDERLKYNCLDMPILTWAEFAYVKPITSQTLADLRGIYLREDGQFLLASSPPGALTGYPAITLNNVGRGKVIYISGDIFSAYIKKNQWNLKRIVKNLVNLIVPEKLVELDAPDVIEVVLARKENLILVHLINHSGERPIDRNNALTEEVIPIYNVKVKVQCRSYPKCVKLLPENISLPWKVQDSMILINVPKIEIHSCVVIEQ